MARADSCNSVSRSRVDGKDPKLEIMDPLLNQYLAHLDRRDRHDMKPDGRQTP